MLRVSGDPLEMILPLEASQESIDKMRVEWGLDQPLYVQYSSYIGKLLQGDFGRSITDGRPALAVVMEKVPATLELMGVGLLIALVLGDRHGHRRRHPSRQAASIGR